MTRNTSDSLDGVEGSGGRTGRKTDASTIGRTRRRVLAATGTATAAGLAGCSGFLGGGGGNGGGQEFTQEESGSVASNDVDGIEIVGWTSEALEESFQVTVTVHNSGDRTSGLIDYSYSLALYDESGAEIPSGGILARSTAGDIASGETGELRLSITGMDEPSTVARYEISVTCDDMFADGAYCQ